MPDRRMLFMIFLVPLVVACARAAPAVHTPAVGSPIRVGVMDATRLHLGLNPGGDSRFKVFHLKTDGQWTYFEGNEIVDLGDNDWQETDLTVKALFQFEDKVLRVRALWSLPDNDRFMLRQFESQVAEIRRRAALPDALFPETSRVPGDLRQATKARAAPRQTEPTREMKNREALWAAIKAYDLAAVQAAVARGADFKAAGEFQRTPLHEAVRGVNVPLVEWLLANGADPNAADGDGRTPLHRTNVDHLSVLLRHGADLLRLDKNGNTVLHTAAERHPGAGLCKKLIQAGIPANARNRAGLTPLHFAVFEGREITLKTLIDLGADVNARTTAAYVHKDSGHQTGSIAPAGSTPVSLARRLHEQNKWVSGRYHEAVAEYLLSRGAVERKWWQFGR